MKEYRVKYTRENKSRLTEGGFCVYERKLMGAEYLEQELTLLGQFLRLNRKVR